MKRRILIGTGIVLAIVVIVGATGLLMIDLSLIHISEPTRP